MVMELDPAERSKPENMLIGGVYFGLTKPDMALCVRRFFAVYVLRAALACAACAFVPMPQVIMHDRVPRTPPPTCARTLVQSFTMLFLRLLLPITTSLRLMRDEGYIVDGRCFRISPLWAGGDLLGRAALYAMQGVRRVSCVVCHVSMLRGDCLHLAPELACMFLYLRLHVLAVHCEVWLHAVRHSCHTRARGGLQACRSSFSAATRLQ